MKKTSSVGFADLAVERRKIKSEFFDQINQVVDWRPISELIDEHYVKGTSATGTPAYDGLLLFRMGLLQTWYGLSDYEVEDRLNEEHLLQPLCGPEPGEQIPRPQRAEPLPHPPDQKRSL